MRRREVRHARVESFLDRVNRLSEFTLKVHKDEDAVFWLPLW
jgi:hypothetical protein